MAPVKKVRRLRRRSVGVLAFSIIVGISLKESPELRDFLVTWVFNW